MSHPISNTNKSQGLAGITLDPLCSGFPMGLRCDCCRIRHKLSL